MHMTEIVHKNPNQKKTVLITKKKKSRSQDKSHFILKKTPLILINSAFKKIKTFGWYRKRAGVLRADDWCWDSDLLLWSLELTFDLTTFAMFEFSASALRKIKTLIAMNKAVSYQSFLNCTFFFSLQAITLCIHWVAFCTVLYLLVLRASLSLFKTKSKL